MVHALVVDDDTDLRQMLTILLQCEGHHVVEVANGQLALDALASGQRFGVVVLDLAMPVMDGPTFLEHKSRGAHASVPVIIFSSTTPATTLQGFDGVVAVVPKTAGIGGLLAVIGSVVEGSAATARARRRI